MNLLHEEEERIAKQADGLQRRSSQMKFNYVNTNKSRLNNSAVAATVASDDEEVEEAGEAAAAAAAALQQSSNLDEELH